MTRMRTKILNLETKRLIRSPVLQLTIGTTVQLVNTYCSLNYIISLLLFYINGTKAHYIFVSENFMLLKFFVKQITLFALLKDRLDMSLFIIILSNMYLGLFCSRLSISEKFNMSPLHL
jgi:hypothetical protein